MILVDVKNKYLFKSKKTKHNTRRELDNKVHTYAAYEEKGEVRLVPLTHVWVRDKKRWKSYKKKYIKLVHFNDEHTTPNLWENRFGIPSGVNTNYYASDVNGKPINLNNPNVVHKGAKHLPVPQEKIIKNFAYRRYESGKELKKKP